MAAVQLKDQLATEEGRARLRADGWTITPDSTGGWAAIPPERLWRSPGTGIALALIAIAACFAWSRR